MNTQTLVVPKFDYASMSRQSINGKRFYSTPTGEKLPSVTTILSATMPQEKLDGLQKWRDAVGHQKAQTITTEAAGVGTVMHKLLEEHTLGLSKQPGTNMVQKIAYPMAQKIINEGLIHLNELWGVEIPLYFPGLYAGSTDGAGLWKGNEAIFDYKQTNKPKKDEYVEDYKMQLTAYALAHNEVYKTNIRTGVILMCSRACEYQQWVIEGEEFDYWADQWWSRVEKYYSVVA